MRIAPLALRDGDRDDVFPVNESGLVPEQVTQLVTRPDRPVWS